MAVYARGAKLEDGLDLHPGNGVDALCRLRDQRLCRPELRWSRRAHAGASAGGRTDQAVGGARGGGDAGACCVRAGAATQQAHHPVVGGGGGIAATYPFTKRFFVLPQAYLGIAFGFGIPMAFAAHAGRVPAVAWLLLLANVFWAVAYDTEYAMVDREDDRKDRHQDIRNYLRPPRRDRGDDLPRDISSDPCLDRLALCAGNLLLRRTADGGVDWRRRITR